MKRCKLNDSCFDGMVGGTISRRAVLLELEANRHVFGTPTERFFRQTWKYMIIGAAVLLFILSITALQRWQVWDMAEKNTISAIYRGSKADAEKNKTEAFKRLDIAGASGEGRRR